MIYICKLNSRAINSVGSECLPYKEEVGGSSPSLPTIKKPTQMSGFLFIQKIFSSPQFHHHRCRKEVDFSIL